MTRNEYLEAENQRLREENERLKSEKSSRSGRNASNAHERAQPVSRDGGNNFDSYVCSKCGVGCFYDGRCGDGPVLMCDCNAAEDAYWANERR